MKTEKNNCTYLGTDGFVRIDDCMADDLSVVNAARVSFAKKSSEIGESEIGLIGFLMRERHGTPFEHNSFRFHVRCPIFVAREWFRHRIGSFNEFSGRYSQMTQDAYVPEWDAMREQAGKPGAYKFVQITDDSKLMKIDEIISSAYENSFSSYQELLSMGLAKELARIVIPVGSYTEFYWTVNARSLMNFLSLRTHDTAQLEIREFANAVEEIFAVEMPITYLSWLQNKKVAP
jgi:thymidylate synthase (FAD)